jgi:squalene synthase HpnC
VATIAAQLERNGPERCERMAPEEARAWCRRLALGHYENFSVLSALVPARLRDDFAAVYAFCRWSDDLGDEVGDRARALELLAWWRGELAACFEGAPRHPVFVALRPTVERHALDMAPFAALIGAFEQDQTKDRYATWGELLDYCSRSADPVGRIVLALFGQATPERVALSDRTCTALQITNHLQDVRRDLLERDRIYLPAECTAGIRDFELRLRESAEREHACDREFLAEYRAAVRPLAERVWTLFEEGEHLLPLLAAEALPVVRLFGEGGQHVLRQIHHWNYETCIHRPRLGRLTKAWLVARAWMAARVAGRRA